MISKGWSISPTRKDRLRGDEGKDRIITKKMRYNLNAESQQSGMQQVFWVFFFALEQMFTESTL